MESNVKKEEYYHAYRIGNLRGGMGQICAIAFEKEPNNKGRIILVDGYDMPVKTFPVEDMQEFLQWILKVTK